VLSFAKILISIGPKVIAVNFELELPFGYTAALSALVSK